VGPSAGLDAVVKRKNPCPCQESNPGHPAHSFVTILTELSWLIRGQLHFMVTLIINSVGQKPSYEAESYS
jgi:hypothetical protein